MLFVLREFVIVVFNSSLLAHFFQVFDFTIRETTLPQILVLFLFPAEVSNRLAPFPSDCHIHGPAAADIATLPGSIPKSLESTHDTVALALSLSRTSFVWSASNRYPAIAVWRLTLIWSH